MAQVLLDAGTVLNAVRKAMIDFPDPLASPSNEPEARTVLGEIEEVADWAVKYPLAGKYVALTLPQVRMIEKYLGF